MGHDRGVVDQDVDPAEAGERLPDHLSHLVLVPHIHADRQDIGKLPKLACRLLEPLGVEVRDHDLGLLLRESPGGVLPDPLGRAGYDGYFSFKHDGVLLRKVLHCIETSAYPKAPAKSIPGSEEKAHFFALDGCSRFRLASVPFTAGVLLLRIARFSPASRQEVRYEKGFLCFSLLAVVEPARIWPGPLLSAEDDQGHRRDAAGKPLRPVGAADRRPSV